MSLWGMVNGYWRIGHDGDNVGERVLTGRVGVKASDQTVSSGSYANDTGVAVAVRANRRYRFVHFFSFIAADTSQIEVAYTWPSGATVRWHQSANTNTDAITATDSGISWGGRTGQPRDIEHRGIITTGGTAGTLQSRVRVATGGNKTMEASSHIVLYDLGPA